MDTQGLVWVGENFHQDILQSGRKIKNWQGPSLIGVLVHVVGFNRIGRGIEKTCPIHI